MATPVVPRRPNPRRIHAAYPGCASNFDEVNDERERRRAEAQASLRAANAEYQERLGADLRWIGELTGLILSCLSALAVFVLALVAAAR